VPLPTITNSVLYGFWDELTKLADVSTAGLSPQTVLEMPHPEPMETLAVQRAKDILSRADASKTAAAKEEDSPTRRIGGRALAGAATGNLLSQISLKRSGSLSPLRKTVGTLVGAGVGAADGVFGTGKKKESSAGMSLLSSRKTATFMNKPRLGHGMQRTAGLTGHAGRIPKITGSKP
jgi:hypothetical protein